MSEIIDNRAHRIRTLKEIIRHLHRGGSPDEVRGHLREMVRETEASEIAAMEQELIAEGMPVEEIQSMCDLHSAVLRDVVVDPPRPPLPPGHPVDTFRMENEALRAASVRLRLVLEGIRGLPVGSSPAKELLAARQVLNDLMDVEKHYQRKENLLFSCLERHGITGPSKVMWGKDDEVRELLRALGESLSATDGGADEWRVVVEMVAVPAVAALEEMIEKEERILLPMALSTLTEDEWGEIWQQSPRYGWCLVEPRQGYQPPAASRPGKVASVAANEAIELPTGSLTPEQLLGLFGALPVDLTLVDADDRVRYFSEGPDRVFARSKAILGRKVQHCHPPKSVHIVEQILADFRSGRHSVAEFWIQFQGRFVHIRYLALRGASGEYLGTLEVTQDVTRIRALEGERRLLEYEDSEP